MARMDPLESAIYRAMRATGGMLCALSMLAAAGCSTFSQSQASHDQVVQARQLTQRAVQAMHRSDWQNATDLLAEAKQSSPYDVQARTHYAEALWQTGQRKKAIAELVATVKISSDDPLLHTRLGRMYLEEGEPTQAHLAANTAIDCDPRCAAAWKLQGDLAQLRRDPAAAKLSYIRAAMYGGTTDPEVQLRLATTYRQAGQPSQALACISLIQQTQIGDRMPPQVGIEQALAYRDQGRHLDAADRLGQLAETGDLSADLLLVWAECEVSAGRLARAEYAANAALRLNPQHGGALHLVSQLPGYRQQAEQAWRR